MTFEPRHEAALEYAIGALLARSSEPQVAATIRDLRDLEQRLIAEQVLTGKWQRAQTVSGPHAETGSLALVGGDGYEFTDPKSAGYHDRVSDLWDSRPGK